MRMFCVLLFAGQTAWTWATAVVPGEPLEMEPNAAYLLTLETKTEKPGGAVTAGTPFSRYSYRADGTGRWSSQTNILFTPSVGHPIRTKVDVGAWEIRGAWETRNLAILPLDVKYARKDGIELGHGESISGNDYLYSFPFGDEGRNAARAIVAQDCVLAGQLWWFSGASQFVTYGHRVEGRRFLSGHVLVGTSDWRGAKGGVTVEASADGGDFVPLGVVTNVSCVDVDLPESLFPAREVRVRVKGMDPRPDIQIAFYNFRGRIDGDPVRFAGATRFYEKGTSRVVREIRPAFIETSRYGERLGASGNFDLWGASSCRKVRRDTPLPDAERKAKGLVIRTAANEAEPVQLVVRPRCALADLRVSVSGPGWITAHRVGYVDIRVPTDYSGVPGPMPELLVPQTPAPAPARADENQPFWITAKPPKGTPRGICRAALRVEGRTPSGAVSSFTVPLEVEVFGFEIPDQVTCQTSFGFTSSNLKRMQNLKTEEEYRAMAEKCLKVMGEHHLSPYCAAPFASYHFRWENLVPGADVTKAEPRFDWAEWDAAVSRGLNEYGFSSFMVGFPGLGFCDMSNRRPPNYQGYTPKDPEYDILLGKYAKALESHLREKGWLDRAYVYVFDEPTKRDYDLVRAGYGLLARHAPGIRRLLPGAPIDSTRTDFDGVVNLWCPGITILEEGSVARRRKDGSDVWWYMANFPKAPFIGEFYDHQSAELRTWLWVTWKEGISGVLIWEVCDWRAKPDRFPDANGEARFFYPAPEAGFPYVSLRMDHLRDGLEDYEYFAMLKRLDPKNPLLEVPSDVARNIIDFNPNPAGLERHRLRLAREIERLQKRSK